MSRLRAFTVQVDADGPLTHKQDSERPSSLREGPDPQRGVHHREPEDVSPRCMSRRALSPHTNVIGWVWVHCEIILTLTAKLRKIYI